MTTIEEDLGQAIRHATEAMKAVKAAENQMKACLFELSDTQRKLADQAKSAALTPQLILTVDELDKVLWLRDRLTCREIDAGACRTDDDVRRRREAEKELEDFYGKLCDRLRGQQ
jgi:hypothetical protein